MKSSNSERVHIGIFGNTNSGKSTLINYITGTNFAIISEKSGTTTDPIRKAMELTDFGSVLFIDTAGLSDFTDLGKKRMEKTLAEVDKIDIFLYVLSENDEENIKLLEGKNVIYIAMRQDLDQGREILKKYEYLKPLGIDIRNTDTRDKLFDKIKKIYKKEEHTITGSLVSQGDVVVLVMPQDKAAPKDRLIKPQVMTIRELIDKNASVVCTNLKNLENTVNNLKNIDLIITDSQIFKEVYNKKPKKVRLTSFSILFSAFKGDINYYLNSVKVLDENIKNILIAEACIHPPTNEDIGTVKIPKLIKKINPNINFDFVRGDDFIDYEKYDLIISCGCCMFNRTYVKNRIKNAKDAGVAMTNYGIVIAYLNKILDKISVPE